MTAMGKTLLLGAIAFAGALAAPHAADAAMRVSAPELDAGSALAALTLLSGALAVARGRWGGKK